MRAMELLRPAPASSRPLRSVDRPDPSPGPGEILVRVSACAVCRTDLQLCEGDLAPHRAPSVPGHQIVGRVAALGEGVAAWRPGDRVGVAWLAGTDGTCPRCLEGRENLCAAARFTGWDCDGGFATHALVRADFALAFPRAFADARRRAAVVRGRHRLPRAQRQRHRAGAATRSLRLRRVGDDRHPGRAPLGVPRVRVHALAGRAAARDRPRCRVDGRLRRASARAARRGGDVRAGGERRRRGPSRARPRRHGRDQRHPPRSHPGAFLRRPLVGAVPSQRGELHPRRRPGAARPRGGRSLRTEHEVLPLDAANDALLRLSRGEVRGAAVLDCAAASPH